jgi:hypothetical protein
MLIFYVINGAHKQYSLSDTISNCIFYLYLQENIYKQIENTYYMLAGFAGRLVVGSVDLSIDVFLEVQDERYS